MVNPGVLAAMLNFLLLLVVSAVERVVEVTVRGFTKSRLLRKSRALLVHDSDTWLFNIPRSVYKYRKNPAILFTLITAVAIIVSELVSEVGIDTSRRCGPEQKKGSVIVGGNAVQFTDSEVAAASFFLQNLEFEDGKLERVAVGYPRHVTSSLCLNCFKKSNESSLILGDCQVREYKNYTAGSIEVGVVTTKSAFLTITVGFRIGNDIYPGKGDLTDNGEICAMFLVHSKGKKLYYFEYLNNSHCVQFKSTAQNNSSIQWNPTRSITRVQEISCTQNQISADTFRRSVQAYRTMQLENSIQEFRTVPTLTADDINRAVLAAKIIDEKFKVSSYPMYTECGRYKMKWLVPLFICLFILVLLNVTSCVLVRKRQHVLLPFNSNSWLRFHKQHLDQYASNSFDRNSAFRSSSIYDELVLVGSEDDFRVELRRS